MRRDIRIDGDTVALGELLELAGVIADGDAGNALLARQVVSVNSEPEMLQARKLSLDDRVRVGGLELRVTSADLDIRRPDLRGVRRRGTVRWYSDDKGYGRITAEDGEVLFVHFSAIHGDGYRSLKSGQRVSFVWDGGTADHGRHAATDVRAEPGEARG